MQALATGKDSRGNARASAGELPDAASLGVHAAAVNVQPARAGRGEGNRSAGRVARRSELMAMANESTDAAADPWNLTTRERQVLALMLENAGALKVVAGQLGLSFKTVDTFLGRARRRMGSRTRFEALITFDRWARAQ